MSLVGKDFKISMTNMDKWTHNTEQNIINKLSRNTNCKIYFFLKKYIDLILKLKQKIEFINLKVIQNIVFGLNFKDKKEWKQQNRAWEKYEWRYEWENETEAILKSNYPELSKW